MKTRKQLQLLLLSLSLMLAGGMIYAQQESKEIKKSFQLEKGDNVKIENKFGNINIMNWDKPEISVSVKLTSDSQKNFLDKINIEIIREGKSISVATILESESGIIPGSKFSINYEVYVPQWINLSLVNKFGNITVEDILGQLNIDLKHGDLRINDINKGEDKQYNQIDMSYSHAYIDNAGSVKLNLEFAKIEFDNADDIICKSKYSGITASSCKSLNLDSKYDNFKFDELRNLVGDLQYSNLRIGEFNGKLELESSYTGIKIDDVLPSFELIKINNERGNCKIAVNHDTNFTFSGSSRNGDININGFDNFDKKIEGNTKQVYISKDNKGTGKIINVNVDAGTLSFNRN